MIISTEKRNGKTQEMLKQAMKENELLGEALKNARQEIAKLKRENASLKANKDKIRAEIDKARYIDKDTRICKNALARGLEAAMQIIDKYKEEGEGKE